MKISPVPRELILHKISKQLELVYEDHSARLSAEFLRVYSPSAEVRRHGHPVLQTGKRFVAIRSLQPAGNYGVKICFDDGHDTGIFTWTYLWELTSHQGRYWRDYLEQLNQAGGFREPDTSLVRLQDPSNED